MKKKINYSIDEIAPKQGSALEELKAITTGAEPKQAPEPKAAQKKKEKKPKKKSESLLLLLYPEQKQKLKALAGYKQVSVNTFLNDLLEEAFIKHKEELEQLQAIQKGK